MTDTELLKAWAKDRDESAFAELVRRHLDLVYASALRQVRNPALAQDVSQAVFVLLAQKAQALGEGVILSGWLFQSTRFLAARASRAERRRTHHELQATMDPTQIDSPSSSGLWEQVGPHLDDALAMLPETDRQAVICRFFEHQPLRIVGERLGLGEEAAKKRVSRSLEKLREFLLKRGVALTIGALTTLLLNPPVQAAPADLAGQILRAAVTKALGTSGTSFDAASPTFATGGYSPPQPVDSQFNR